MLVGNGDPYCKWNAFAHENLKGLSNIGNILLHRKTFKLTKNNIENINPNASNMSFKQF